MPSENQQSGMRMAAGGGNSLLRVNLALETDFLLARQRAKQIATMLGFELQDQTRIATAVSEIARNAWEYAGGGQVEYFLDPGATVEELPRLRITISDKGPGIGHLDQIWAGTYQSQTGMGIGLIGARRLVDELEVRTGSGGTHVGLIKAVPKQALPMPSLAELSAELARRASFDRMGSTVALHDQNQELVTLLTDLRAREAELQALNVELEETNRGVLVLYAELADKAQAVQAASEMKTRFLSGVTHELRTPLNSIVSLARLMLGHTDGPLNAEQEKQVNFILRSAQNLTEMVNDLLDLAKIEAGKSSINLSHFTVQELFAGLRGMFRPLVSNPEVKLLFEIPDERIELHSDEGKLSQILRNFISNALKFTDSGSIVVTARPLGAASGDGREIRFSVADTGMGIAPEHHDLVMQEWGQVGDATPRRSQAKGSGLGLPLSRSLAEVLGGLVGFTSTPHVGSTFFVTLPALEPQGKGQESSIAGDQSGHILIVDDDEVARYLLRRQLGSLTSAPVEEVTGGGAALAAIAHSIPRLVFLDLLMPEVAGDVVVRTLRGRPGTATLPIVLHTSKPLTEGEIQAYKELDVTVIPKRPAAGNTLASDDALRVALERALLEVGLSNLHQERAR